MAIFGNLKDMPITDLLPLLSYKDGALELFNLGRHPSVTLYLKNGLLACMYLGGREVEPLKARTEMNHLTSLRRGAFEFIPGTKPPRCLNPLGWPLDRLLLATVTVQDEIQGMRQQLPHPDTVFRIVEEHRQPQDQRLQDFWARSLEKLKAGSTARKLSAIHGMPLDQARYYLLQLRQSGLIEPHRTEPSSRSNRGVAARLLGAIKSRFWGGKKSWNH